MQVLRTTANSGCACILSIHQPPSKLFYMFDHVLLLTRLGEQAYFGPPQSALSFMQRMTQEVVEKVLEMQS